jgi:peptidoglycan/LPS O-acetylase OafA/YrhL
LNLNYRPEIDGLRAIAVVPVVLFHAKVAGFSGGYLGVDVFFVISGFLITGLIINDLNRAKFSIIDFYERRARRILPALFFVTLVCVPFAWFWMTPDDLRRFFQSVLAVPLFVSNFLFWRQSGYFSTDADVKPLLHTWSLAVEEQFYIFFPLLLLLVFRLDRRLILPTLIAFAVGSLALSEWGWRNAASANFFLSPTRFWQLLAGGICAVVMTRRKVPSSDPISWVGLMAVVVSVLVFDQRTPSPSVFTLLPVTGTCLLLLFPRKDTLAGRMLARPLFVRVGLVSYSLYLWHQPILAFARLKLGEAPDGMLLASLLFLSAVLAFFSWKWVGKPFRRRGSSGFLVPRRIVIGLSAASIALFVSLGLIVSESDIWRPVYLAGLPAEKRVLYLNIERARLDHEAARAGNFGNGGCVFNVRAFTDAVRERLTACNSRHGSGVLILGDSHGIDIHSSIAVSEPDEPFVVGIVAGFCRPHSSRDGCYYEAVANFVAEKPGLFSLVVYTQAGYYLLLNDQGRPSGRQHFQRSKAVDMSGFSTNQEFVQQVKEYLSGLARHVDVVWLGPRLEPHIRIAKIAARGCAYPYELLPGLRETFADLDLDLRRALSGNQVRYLSQQALIDLKVPEDLVNCSSLFFSDVDHYSAQGEKLFGARLKTVSTARQLEGSGPEVK